MMKASVISRRALTIAVSVILLAVILWAANPSKVWSAAQDIPGWALTGMLALLVINLFVVSLRLWRMHGHFGIALPWSAAYRACISGQLAGLMVISLFGQILGRQAVLRRHGISPAFSASLVAYERMIMVLIGGTLCAFGAVWLLGWTAVADWSSRLSLVEVLLAVLGGAALSLLLGRSRFEKGLMASLKIRRTTKRLLEISGITLFSSFLMLTVFVLALHAVQPQVDLPLFAASAVISFAASMPISVNGWGIREVAAVYMLKPLGVSSAHAISASIFVGLCSTAVVLVAAALVLKRKTRPSPSNTVESPKTPVYADLEKAAVWMVPMATAILVFFQMHVPLVGIDGKINLNLADPFALLALAALFAHSISLHQAPQWRASHINTAWVLIGAVLTFSFFRGMADIGVTQWALGARLMGWPVLLGYVSAGYLIVSHAGSHGLRRITETMVATGVVIVILQVTLRWFSHFGLYPEPPSPNFEGHAANRNAFAFQMLICMILVLAHSPGMARWHARSQHRLVQWRVWATGIMLGIVSLGIVLSGSRTGLICAAIILLLAMAVKLADRRTVLSGISVAAFLWSISVLLPIFLMQSGNVLQSSFSSDTSNIERWDSISRGMEMWIQSPLLGAGLGVFYERSQDWYGYRQVIHNTPVWILAELGLVGAIAFGWVFYVFARPLFKKASSSAANRILGMTLLCFTLFSLAHEIFYQRIFWLVLGAVLALPAGHLNRRDHNA